MWDKAVAYLRQAGAKALGHSAYREAVTFFEQALEALGSLPESRHTREQAIDLRLDMRGALLGVRRVSADPHPAARGRRPCHDAGRSHRLGRISAYLSQYFDYAGDYEHAVAAGQRR